MEKLDTMVEAAERLIANIEEHLGYHDLTACGDDDEDTEEVSSDEEDSDEGSEM